VFIGGAAGKLACGWIANWLGNVATIAMCQALASVGIVVILLLPLQLTLIILPFVGLVLNGVTTVIYGSVPNYSAPARRTHPSACPTRPRWGRPPSRRPLQGSSATPSASPAPSSSYPR